MRSGPSRGRAAEHGRRGKGHQPDSRGATLGNLQTGTYDVTSLPVSHAVYSSPASPLANRTCGVSPLQSRGIRRRLVRSDRQRGALLRAERSIGTRDLVPMTAEAREVSPVADCLRLGVAVVLWVAARVA